MKESTFTVIRGGVRKRESKLLFLNGKIKDVKQGVRNSVVIVLDIGKCQTVDLVILPLRWKHVDVEKWRESLKIGKWMHTMVKLLVAYTDKGIRCSFFPESITLTGWQGEYTI